MRQTSSPLRPRRRLNLAFVIMRFIGKAQNPKLADFAIFPTDWWADRGWCSATTHTRHMTNVLLRSACMAVCTYVVFR
jgi:hypothetical protein